MIGTRSSTTPNCGPWAAVPKRGRGLEIGAGSGRFAVPLGIGAGVEPSEKMRALARARGVDAADGVAERLPSGDGTFDYTLFVTTICFVDDAAAVFREAYRLLKKGGAVIVGFVWKTAASAGRTREVGPRTFFLPGSRFLLQGGSHLVP